MWSRPSMMALSSASSSRPISASMRACACEPRMSWRHRRRSKLTDSENASTSVSVDSAKRPPQSFAPGFFLGWSALGMVLADSLAALIVWLSGGRYALRHASADRRADREQPDPGFLQRTLAAAAGLRHRAGGDRAVAGQHRAQRGDRAALRHPVAVPAMDRAVQRSGAVRGAALARTPAAALRVLHVLGAAAGRHRRAERVRLEAGRSAAARRAAGRHALALRDSQPAGQRHRLAAAAALLLGAPPVAGADARGIRGALPRIAGAHPAALPV